MKNLLVKQTKKINAALNAPGIFNDEYWMGQKMIQKQLDEVCNENGLEWFILDSKYDHEDGVPCRKTWHFEVTDGLHTGTGVIVAAGAGAVADPLSQYDIVAYI